MQRRKFIAGLGSLTAAGAAGIGTGAFTSVEADRSLSIATAGDANAFLSITKAEDSDGNVYPNAAEYVHEDNGQLSLDFTQVDDTADASASGANRNAKTIFDNLLDITNNGTQEVELSIDSDLIASQGGSLGIYAENEQGNPDDNHGLSSSENGQTMTLGVGESATNIGVYIPKGHAVDDLSGGTLTFVAEKTGGNQD